MQDHELNFSQTDDTVWITVNDKITVRVMQTGEGVVCDMYDTALLSDDMFAAHTTACYTFFNEVGEDTENTENREDE